MLRRIDRLAGGRHASYTVPVSDDPAVRRAFVLVARLLVVAVLLDVASVLIASALAEAGDRVTLAVWLRCLVLLGITATLFFFVWRARAGKYWAFRRLQLFCRVFPVVAIVLAAVPDLYPAWVVADQVAFAAVLVAVSAPLYSGPVRRAFPSPA